MKMARTLSVAILCIMATLLVAAPAYAQFFGPDPWAEPAERL